MKLVWIITILILLVVVLMPGILAIGIKKIPSGFQSSLSDTELLFGDIVVSQTFTAQKDNLSAIALTVKNPLLKNKKDLIFNLTSHSEQRSVIINGASIYDGAFVYFPFEPISNSKDQVFTFTFSSPQTTTEDSYELYHTANKSVGLYKVKTEEKSGQLAFVSYYKPASLFSNWGLIYAQWFNKFFQDTAFALIYMGLLIGLGGYLLFSRNTHQVSAKG